MTEQRLRQAIGERVRALRDARGMTADDVSRAARDCGLAWSRSTVAALERGDKSVSAEELLLLTLVFVAGQGQRQPTLADFLPAGSGWIGLSPRARLTGDALQKIARGDEVPLPEMDLPAYAGPAVKAALRQMMSKTGRQTLRRTVRQLSAIWANPPADIYRRVEVDAKRDAEQKLAHRLGVPARAVSLAAHRTFGRGLSDERDHRTGEGASPQKRGRVTRQLVDEIQPLIDRYQEAEHGDN